jgi:hypothetical protein
MSFLNPLRIPLLVLLLPKHAHAASTFITICTLPTKNPTFVSGPNIRGTLSILWNSLVIIILCTWSIQHLNISAQRPLLPLSTPWFSKARKILWWAILDSRKKMKWMFFTILVPEFILGKAISDRNAAGMARDNFRRLKMGTDDQHFESVHGYFADMGGYYLDFTHLFRPLFNGPVR